MGSFSAVINFRTPLSSRWRYTSYHFFSGNNTLSNRSRVKIGFRFFKSRVFFKLGVYVSHFVFSSAQYVSFLDIHFDRKFFRFQKKLAKLQILENFITIVPKFSNNHRVLQNTRPFYFPFVASLKRMRKFIKLGINTSCRKVSFFRPDICSVFINAPKSKNNCLLLVNKLFSVESRLDFRFFFTLTKNKTYPKYKKKSIISNKKIYYLYPTVNFSNFYLTSTVLRTISSEAWENLGICFPYPNKNFNRIDNNVKNNSSICYTPNSIQLEFFSIKDQFYIRLMQAFRFFLTYYFRFDPIRFVKIFKYSNFFNLKNFKEVKTGGIYAGYRQKWLKFAYKNICKWFLKKYYLSLRSSIFFCPIKKLQITNYTRWFGKTVNLSEPSFNNLSNFTSISAGLISFMFSKRLRMRERVNPILYSLMRLVISRKKVRGLVIFRGGRFTKRQRTLRSALRVGKVSFNSYIMPIDYGFSTAILKYSIVSIKVWISSVPSAGFFSKGLEMSNNFSYPSSLANFRIFERLYIKKIFKLANSMIPVTFFIRPVIGLFVKYNYFKFSIKFISSWNFGYFRAYRRFSKFYLFSKAKYLARIRKDSTTNEISISSKLL